MVDDAARMSLLPDLNAATHMVDVIKTVNSERFADRYCDHTCRLILRKAAAAFQCSQKLDFRSMQRSCGPLVKPSLPGSSSSWPRAAPLCGHWPYAPPCWRTQAERRRWTRSSSPWPPAAPVSAPDPAHPSWRTAARASAPVWPDTQRKPSVAARQALAIRSMPGAVLG